MFRHIEYELKNVIYCPLYISCNKKYLIRISPGPDSDELSLRWANLLENELSNIDVYYKMDRYDISSCDGDVIIKDRKYDEIPQEVFEVVRKITTCVAIIGLGIIVNQNVNSTEIYFSAERDQSMCISLDVRDQHIESVTIDLSLCAEYGIITVLKPIIEKPDLMVFDEVIKMILTIIRLYLTRLHG